MNSFIGGRFQKTSGRLDGLLDYKEGSDSWCHDVGDFTIKAGYERSESSRITTWSDGRRAGVVHGVVTNLVELGWSLEDMFLHLLRDPVTTAPNLEGCFVIICQDTSKNQQLIVSDKLGTRAAFYTNSGPFRYASDVDKLLEFLTEQSLDIQAVSDMLLLGHLWGDRTLVQEISALRPSSVLEVVNGERSLTRYWKPDYREAKLGQEFLGELVRRYRQAVRRVTRTLPSDAGIWLSGGLDSRTTAAALVQQGRTDNFELSAYTYDANPPTNDNPKIAREVARTLGITHQEVPLTAATVGQNFERIVNATDGMLMWAVGANLAATYEINNPTPVLMEGMQGALLGDHLYRHHLYDFSNVVKSQLSSEAIASPDEAQRFLTESVDPFTTLKSEAERSAESSTREKILDVHFQNYYNRLAMPSNRLMRERVGTRVIHADGDYLEWCAKLPRSYRKGAFRSRWTPDGGIPYEPTRAKLALIRNVDPELAKITYERTKVKPSHPYPIHVMGFIGNVLVNRLRSNPTYGSSQLADYWIRDSCTAVHDHVTRLVDDACSRDIFDSNAVKEVYDAHLEGENNASILSRITTLESWIQNHLD